MQGAQDAKKHRISTTSVASVDPHDVAQAEKEGRTEPEAEEIEGPTMREIRYLDELIDELARGKAMVTTLRRG